MDLPSPPPIIQRPKLALWMHLRGLKNKEVAPVLGVGAEQVRRYCLPFGDPVRVVPPQEVMGRIVGWTGGELEPNDFYDPADLAPCVTEGSLP